MTDRELMQQALDALDSDNPDIQLRAATALRARLAQQEPLPEKSKGALSHEENKQHNKKILDKFYEENAHLYKTQPEQEPVTTLFGSLPVYDVPQKQEPVAWMHNFIDEVVIAHRPADLDRHPDRWTPLYKDPTPCQTCKSLARTVMMDQTYHDSVMAQRDETPAKAVEWKGLTDEEMMMIYGQSHEGKKYSLGRAIEAKLKDKNEY